MRSRDRGRRQLRSRDFRGVPGGTDGVEEIRSRDWLDEAARHAQIPGPSNVGGAMIRGKHHDDHPQDRRFVLEGICDLEASHPRHAAIEKNQLIGRPVLVMTLQLDEGLDTAFDFFHRSAQGGQHLLQDNAARTVVVHHQDPQPVQLEGRHRAGLRLRRKAE